MADFKLSYNAEEVDVISSTVVKEPLAPKTMLQGWLVGRAVAGQRK